MAVTSLWLYIQLRMGFWVGLLTGGGGGGAIYPGGRGVISGPKVRFETSHGSVDRNTVFS